jgi:hypothetical protein
MKSKEDDSPYRKVRMNPPFFRFMGLHKIQEKKVMAVS